MATTLANISIKDSSSWNTLLNLIYPVGSLYFSYTSTSPASRFGGSWSAITGRFIYANASISTGGGEKHSHTLSSNGGACIDLGMNAAKDSMIFSHRSNDDTTNLQFTPNYLRYMTPTAIGDASEKNVRTSVALMGKTDSQTASNPSYQSVYCWRRTA